MPASSDPSSIQLGHSRHHDAVSAILGSAQRLGLDRLLFHQPDRCRSLALAMIVSRLLKPGARLRVERELGTTGQTTLAALLDIHDAPVDEHYDAMDWLVKRQLAIERKLAKRHLEQGAIAFYDVSSSYLTGSRCELAARGYSRDHRSDRPQIVYGLLCNHAGCPIAVDAFPGNTGDPTTLATQVDKLRKRFKLSHGVLVGDRGMITQARIHEDPKPLGLDWITRLAPLHYPQARRQQNNTAGLVRFARNSQCHHARSPR